MFKWLATLSSGLQWGFLAIIVAMTAGLSVEATRIVYQAEANSQAQADLKAKDDQIATAQATAKEQSDLAAKNAADLAVANKIIAGFKTQIGDSYVQTPATAAPCIAPVRVQLLNSERSTANSARAR